MKNKKESLDIIGSQTALYIGIPLGTIFLFLVLYISLFPMLDFELVIIGGNLFWKPLVSFAIIPATFIFLLWTAGKKIKSHLDKNYSLIKTSFLFTLFVNSWLFTLLLIIFLVGGLFFSSGGEKYARVSATAIGLTLFAYIISTAITTLTIGLLIVTVTKNRIYRSSLPYL